MRLKKRGYFVASFHFESSQPSYFFINPNRGYTTGFGLQFSKVNSAWKLADINLFDHWLMWSYKIFLVNKNSFVIINSKCRIACL